MPQEGRDSDPRPMDTQPEASDPQETPPPRPPSGTPYGHVVPSDVGNTIGVGVVGPVPTTAVHGTQPDHHTRDHS